MVKTQTDTPHTHTQNKNKNKQINKQTTTFATDPSNEPLELTWFISNYFTHHINVKMQLKRLHKYPTCNHTLDSPGDHEGWGSNLGTGLCSLPK